MKENIFDSESKNKAELNQYNVNSQPSTNLNSRKQNSELINDILDLIKCYICFEPIKKPKICPNCNRFVCGPCILEWLRLSGQNICCICKINADFYDVPFMKNIKDLLDYNKILEEKKLELNEENKKLKIKINYNICKKHNKKILYYCFECNEKLCGKCAALNNNEVRKHQKHKQKVIEYSKFEKSNIMNVINLKDDIQEQLIIIKKYLEKFEESNKIQLEKDKKILDYAYMEIEKKYKIKNHTNSEHLNKLNIIKTEFETKYQYINDILQKIDSLDVPVPEFNIDEEKKNFESYKRKLAEIEIEINNNKDIEVKYFTFTFNKTYESLEKEKNIKMTITSLLPFTINFSLKLIKNEIEVNFPTSINFPQLENNLIEKKNNKIYFVPVLQINNGPYKEFFICKKEDNQGNIGVINNNIDENIVNDNSEYKLLIKLNELNKGDNQFCLYINYYYFNN